MAGDVTLDELWSMNVNYYLSIISYTLLIYEYILTFEMEVTRFWSLGPRLNMNWACGFFYTNRYLTLLGHVPVLIEYFWTTGNEDKPMICHKLQSFHQYLAMLIQAIVASMLIMRMYALYERSKRILSLLVGIAIGAVSVGCWAVLGPRAKHQDRPDVDVSAGCGISLTHEQAVRLGLAWTGMLVFDTVVFGLTLCKSLTIPRTKGMNLLDVLLRDGAVYFSVMMAANLANILTFIFGGPFTRGVATTFTNVVSSIMISRLMLNLRNPSLVSHAPMGNKMDTSSSSTAAVLTYPNLTFTDTADNSGHDADFGYSSGGNPPQESSGGIEREARSNLNWNPERWKNNDEVRLEGEDGGRRLMYYEYLARGSVRRGSVQEARDPNPSKSKKSAENLDIC